MKQPKAVHGTAFFLAERETQNRRVALDFQVGAGQRNRPRHFERMVDTRLDALQERHRVRQFGVDVERRFVDPARVKVKEAWIANRAEGIDG